MIRVDIDLPEAAVEQIARRAAELVLAELQRPEYLTVPEAADYLRCKRHRVYDLLSAGRLTRLKDGTRTLIRRAEIDAYLERA